MGVFPEHGYDLLCAIRVLAVQLRVLCLIELGDERCDSKKGRRGQ